MSNKDINKEFESYGGSEFDLCELFREMEGAMTDFREKYVPINDRLINTHYVSLCHCFMGLAEACGDFSTEFIINEINCNIVKQECDKIIELMSLDRPSVRFHIEQYYSLFLNSYVWKMEINNV